MVMRKNAEACADRGEGRGKGVAILNPLVRDITQALFELGGAAHRDVVVAHIAKKQGVFRPTSSMAQALDGAFFTYCAGAGDPAGASLLHLPYGPFSRRWALTDQAYGLLGGDVDA